MPTAILEAVVGNLAVATALAFVAFAAGRWANRPALAHALWLLVLIKLLTPPLVTIPIRCLPAKAEPTIVSGILVPPGTPISSQPSPVVIVEPTSVVTAAPAPGTRALPPRSAVEIVPPSTLLPPPSPVARVTHWVPTLEVVLLGAWAVGTLVSFGLVVRRARRFASLLNFASSPPPSLVEEVAATACRMGLRRAPRVRVVPGGIAPLVWAVGRPTLFFPSGLLARLSTDQRLALMAHELAHLRRWDHIVRMIEFVALAVYWWCPLAWLSRRELRRLEEEACDADVIAAVPGSGYAYASAILETIDYLAGVAPAPALATGIGDATSLRKRLVLILGTTRPKQTSFGTRLALLAAGLALLAVGPKLHRLTAASNDVEFGSPTTSASGSAPALAPFDEAHSEPIQFLPTPISLIPVGENSTALASALSPDGTRLAIAAGPSVAIWDLDSKRRLFTLVGHTDTINAVVFSPDGSRIATAGNDNTAIIWGSADGRRLHTLAGHDRWVLGAAFSPDSRTLATCGYDKTIRLWDVATGEPKATWTGHTGGVRSIAFAPDGRTIATGGADHEVRLWDVANGITTHTFKKHTTAVRVVAFSPDGTRIVSGSEDRTVRIRNAADGREVGQPVLVPDYVTTLGFSRRGQALFAGTLGGHILHINPTTAQFRGYVGVEPGRPAGSPPHAAAVVAILSPPDGKALYTVSQDGTAMAWPSAGPPQTSQLVFRSVHPMTAAALSPDSAVLATGGQDGTIHLWGAATGRALLTLPGHPGGVSGLTFGAGGRLVSAGADERVRIWDTALGLATHTVLLPTPDLRIALSADGRTLAIGSRKLAGVMLLDLAAPSKPRRIGEWAGEITALTFTATGGQIATGYSDGMVRVWDASKGEELAHVSAGVGSVDGISFSPTGTTIAVVLNGASQPDRETDKDPKHEVVFLDARDCSVLDNLRPLAHPGPITAVAFTAEGRVLTAAYDGNLYLWNTGTAQVVRTIRGHVDAVRGVALTSDGSTVFSAGDHSAKKWPLTGTDKK